VRDPGRAPPPSGADVLAARAGLDAIGEAAWPASVQLADSSKILNNSGRAGCTATTSGRRWLCGSTNNLHMWAGPRELLSGPRESPACVVQAGADWCRLVQTGADCGNEPKIVYHDGKLRGTCP
jgi:hypothetical protein